MQLTFQARMTELAEPDVSELHAMASKNAQEVRGALDKYEIWRRTVSENMSEYLELGRVVSELTEVEGLINDDEEGGGHGSLKDLESELETEEATLTEKKEHMKELQILMTTVSFEQQTIPLFLFQSSTWETDFLINIRCMPNL